MKTTFFVIALLFASLSSVLAAPVPAAAPFVIESELIARDPEFSHSHGVVQTTSPGGKRDPEFSHNHNVVQTTSAGDKRDPEFSHSHGVVQTTSAGGKRDPEFSHSHNVVQTTSAGGKRSPAALEDELAARNVFFEKNHSVTQSTGN